MPYSHHPIISHSCNINMKNWLNRRVLIASLTISYRYPIVSFYSRRWSCFFPQEEDKMQTQLLLKFFKLKLKLFFLWYISQDVIWCVLCKKEIMEKDQWIVFFCKWRDNDCAESMYLQTYDTKSDKLKGKNLNQKGNVN